MGQAGALTKREDQPASMVQVPGSSPVTDLLRLAVERGTPVAEMETLVALYERMEASAARKAFFAALANFQQQCPAIPRSSGKGEAERGVVTKAGTTFKYTWSKKDEILRTAGPHMAANGLSHSFDTESDDKFLTTICTIHHIGGHSKSTRVRVPLENPGGMSPQQKVGSAMEHAERYSLTAALGLSTTDQTPDSDDANPETITHEQAVEIDELLQGASVVPSRFLKAFDAATVPDIRATDYAKATEWLRAKTKGAP